MHVQRGTKRMVLIFPKAKIVIKLPMIRIIQASSILSRLLQRFFGKKVRLPINVKGHLYDILLSGVVHNFSEFRFFLKTKHPFIQPTFFSLLGLFNIQRIGTQRKCLYLWSQLREIAFLGLNDDERLDLYKIIGKDTHHWQNSKNFSFWKDKLYIHDYGARLTQKIIILYGIKLQENFTPKP